MNRLKQLLSLDSLMRVAGGTLGAVSLGFLLLPGHFVFESGNGAMMFLLIGLNGAVAYALLKVIGKEVAIGCAVLLGIIFAALLSAHIAEALVIIAVCSLAIVLFYLNISRLTAVSHWSGQPLLLGGWLVVVGLVLSPMAHFTRPTVPWLYFTQSALLMLFLIGVGFGAGITLAELAIRRRQAGAGNLDQTSSS